MRPAILNPLFADVTRLKGVGPRLGALVAKVSGPRVVDVLFTAPHSIIDRTARPKVAYAPFGSVVTLEITVDRHEPQAVKTRPYRVICSDDTGIIVLIFFHARRDYLKSVLPVGARRLISGRVEEFSGTRQMTHPDHIVDPESADFLPLIEPVYPLTAGLSQNAMRRAVTQAVELAPDLPEWQDPAFLRENIWPDWKTAVRRLHNPDGPGEESFFDPPWRRLAYDELLANQLAIRLMRHAGVKYKGRPVDGDGRLRARAVEALPYALTGDQQKALDEIIADMTAPARMLRLLQGDVGSGKTVVAMLAMLNAVEAGFQAAIMAPTEILALQHLETFGPACEALGVSLASLTGRDKGAAREKKLSAIADGETKIIIGTHALFQESVRFDDLALVVIDEQHRFGVHQRMALAEKGFYPDTLVMTATPIPRSLALTVYGDMEVSAIREKPPGRKPVDTRAMPLDRVDDVIAGVLRAVEKDEQVYWVCPLVEESERLDATPAEARWRVFADLIGERAGLVHGKMAPAEKDAVMERFHAGDVRVLIATTVIEVGVNAPNATIMVIENAERFGLAQLHQLRGRVGRGARKSTCLLLYQAPMGRMATARIATMRNTEDGFEIAEEDLRLRGAGDLLGTAQSGVPQFRLASMLAHGDLIPAATDDAKLIMAKDPTLASPRGEALRTLLYLFSRDDAVKLIRSG